MSKSVDLLIYEWTDESVNLWMGISVDEWKHLCRRMHESMDRSVDLLMNLRIHEEMDEFVYGCIAEFLNG